MTKQNVTAFNIYEFYQRVSSNLHANAIKHQEDGDHLIKENLGIKPVENLKPAAVLIPIIDVAERPHVLLTTRTLALKSHSGQIAFPGGKIDNEDPSPIATALRETEEEIGIASHSIDILGEMPFYKSGSGYDIKPVVGKIIGNPALSLNPDEVEDCFTVPLDFLMNANNHKLDSKIWNNKRRYFYTMPYDDETGTSRYIWGVTAGIIRRLYERLYT
jgi:8-oxo-dGTP pyrophosphatase MutT (NUDIX family)